MNLQLLEKEFHDYAERMAEIKRLSSPKILDTDRADDYSDRLQNSFKEIGRLAAINRKMLDEELYPLLESTGELEDEIAEELEKLAELLLRVASVEDDYENLDLPITSLITKRLLTDAMEKDDICLRIRRMDAEQDVCYSMMNMTERIISNPLISKVYRDMGIAIGEQFHAMLLNKEVFMSISDMECREVVLTVSRFISAFFERSTGDEFANQRNIDILDTMMRVATDDFYKEAVPDFDWRYFNFRVLEYYVQCTDINNARGFTQKQLKLICDRAEKLEALCKTDPSFYGSIMGASFYPVSVARCRYLTGVIDKNEYYTHLINYYSTRVTDDFSVDGAYFNVLLPLEILCQFDPEKLKAFDIELIKDIYQSLSAYIFTMPSNGSMSYALEFFSEIVKRFIEVPGGISVEEFLMRCLAAIHPPTFVHSKMVGQISERLCYHLLKYKTDLFVDFPGCDTINDVIEKKNEILQHIYHSALCHDAGKIFIIDTIFVYGRKLLDFEFELIKSHPEMGYELLCGHSSTREYADVALLHHKWYDDTKGYPSEYKSSDSKYKTIIDIIQCADCMDAATDTVGRSYSKGKTLVTFMEELKEDSGTRYAPWLYELLCHEEVFEDINYLLSEGRKRNYRETYNLLRDVQERNE